jgi:hypothetical protein
MANEREEICPAKGTEKQELEMKCKAQNAELQLLREESYTRAREL